MKSWKTDLFLRLHQGALPSTTLCYRLFCPLDINISETSLHDFAHLNSTVCFCCCVLCQFAIDTLPFGGVGASGFGQYHGKFSFDMFSHKKSVMRRSFLLEYSFRYPPWDGWKLPFMRSVFHFDYVSLLLRLLGLKRWSSPGLTSLNNATLKSAKRRCDFNFPVVVMCLFFKTICSYALLCVFLHLGEFRLGFWKT